LWGQTDDSGKVIVLNISQLEGAAVEGMAAKVDTFILKFNFFLVDWPSMFWSGPGKRKFSAYFE